MGRICELVSDTRVVGMSPTNSNFEVGTIIFLDDSFSCQKPSTVNDGFCFRSVSIK